MVRETAFAVGACQALAGCVDNDESRSTEHDIVWCCTLGFGFDATLAERVAIDSLLGVVAARESVEPYTLDGTVERLATEGSRYAAIIHREPGYEVAIYGMDDLVPATVGEPYLTGIPYNDFNFAVLDIVDRDGDGSSDLTYCYWGEEPGERESTTLGLRGGHWYPIEAPILSLMIAGRDGLPEVSRLHFLV